MTQVSVTVTRCDDADDNHDNHHYLLSPSSGPIRIGRSPANHVKVDFRGISAYHLELRAGLDSLDNGLVRACDLSMNGTSFELPGGEKIALQKGVETSIPDGAKLLIPSKVKREEGQSQDRVSYIVRWHRTQPEGKTAEDDQETPAVTSAAVKTRLGMDSSSRPVTRSESSESDEDNGAPPGKTLNGSTPHPSDVPVPESQPQLPALDTLLNKKKGSAEASSPTNSDSLEESPPAQPTPTVVTSIAGTQLRPKAQPKRPAAVAVQAQPAAANDSSSNSSKEKASKKGVQKSRSRGSSSAKGGQSKSRGRGRGRQRKRSRSGSNSRSRKRRRKRKRSKSRGGKRKRKRSKSRSSSGSKSEDDDDKASSAPPAGNPMPGMQQPWGMHWGAQPAWGWNPYMQGGVRPQMSVDMIKQQIYFMYQRFKPEKLPEYENILKKYKGSEYELLQAMCSKYMGGVNAGPPGGGAPQ